MEGWNRVRLIRGERCVKMHKFFKGCSIFGDWTDPKTIQEWPIEEVEAAKAELKKYKCSYRMRRKYIDVTEYGLEYYDVDEDGDFLIGSDYDLADTDDDI